MQRSSEPADEGDAAGDTPAAQIHQFGGRLFPAWIKVTVRCTAPDGLPMPVVTIDSGNGFEASKSHALGWLGEDTYQASIRLPWRARRMRLASISTMDGMTVTDFRIERQLLPALLWRSLGRYVALGLKKPWLIPGYLRDAGELLWRGGAAALLDVGGPNKTSFTYAAWISRNEESSERHWAALRSRSGSFAYRPLICIVMPAYNSKPSWLTQAIESVRGQVYDNWQLCIADDGSSRPETRATLENYASAGGKIKVEFRHINGGIAEATNTALSLATGEFIAFMDHDDLLSKEALFRIVEQLQKTPDAEIIFSDEDKISETGGRYEPYFKPDWNLDLFHGQNYLNHLSVVRKSVLDPLGGTRSGFDGAQDYDLLLRIIETIDQKHIIHIPRVLYHWRAVSGSTALATDERNYAIEAARGALREHFARTRQQAHVSEAFAGSAHNRIIYPRPKSPPLVSIIVPTRDQVDLLRQCIDSVTEKTSYPNFNIIIVDNQSRDPRALKYLDGLSTQKNIRILPYERPFNFAAINNFAVDQTNAKFVTFLNNDTEVITGDWLGEMLAHAVRPSIGVVGAKLYYPDMSIQHGGIILGIGGTAGHAHKYLAHRQNGYFGRARLTQQFSAVTAACMMVETRLFQELGGFDAEHLTVAFNDVDFCLRVNAAGHKVLWTPYAELFHHESKSRGPDTSAVKWSRARKEERYMREKWGYLLKHDPNYNPNLTLEREDFSLSPKSRIP